MTLRRRQSGMSMLGIFVILFMLGFFALCAIRIAPPYFEYLSVKNILSNIAIAPETAEESVRQIRRSIASNYNTNQIYETEAKDVNIFRRGGKTYIDASYEVRLPIAWRVDAVVSFDDLIYIVGQADPISPDLVPSS